jgi:hypothetical protein
MADLAAQFGHATGGGHALRSAISDPDPSLYRTVLEPHARGSILVSAVFEGFFRTYQHRIADLLRLATGGTGTLGDGELQPDLVDRLAEEAAAAAQTVLTMCIRAFEYLPPMDITFGDFLRALITADRDLLAEDGADQRRVMIEAFRRRGIYPAGVASLSDDALCWQELPDDHDLAPMPAANIAQLLVSDAQNVDRRTHDDRRREARAAARATAPALEAWAQANAAALELDPDRTIAVEGFHGTFRVGPNRRLVVEVVAQFTQQDVDTERDASYGGLRFKGGTTVVATAGGDVRFVIAKPIKSAERRERQLGFVESHDRSDPGLMWADDDYRATRIARLDFRRLHDGLVLR